MNIFAIRKDGFKYKELDLEINDIIEYFPAKYDYGQVHDFSIENIAMGSFWRLLKTEFSEIDDEENLTPDITQWINATLLLSAKAKRLLEDTLEDYGELLPIIIEGQEYFIFNCLTLVDVIEDKCSDAHIEFDQSTVDDKLIFKTRYQNCLDLFCTDRLKALVEDFNLKGIVFDTRLGTFQE